jgi:hypothetical protein
MIESIEETHRLAARALNALKSACLAATPKNLELWFMFVEGRNPALARDIQRLSQ